MNSTLREQKECNLVHLSAWPILNGPKYEKLLSGGGGGDPHVKGVATLVGKFDSSII